MKVIAARFTVFIIVLKITFLRLKAIQEYLSKEIICYVLRSKYPFK